MVYKTAKEPSDKESEDANLIDFFGDNGKYEVKAPKKGKHLDLKPVHELKNEPFCKITETKHEGIAELSILDTAADCDGRKIKNEPQDDVNYLSVPGSKRQRLILEVVVDTWFDFKRKRDTEYEKIKKMKNPKAEKVKGMEFSLSILHDRLKDIGFEGYEVNLDQDVRDAVVSRLFMSNRYGGNTQDPFPKIRAELVAQHGMNDFMYVNVMFHPQGPQLPGKPGIFLSPKPKVRPGAWRVLTRLQSNEWLFVGMYVVQLCASLTREEWNSLEPKVRKTWAHQIQKKKWGGDIRAKIVARRELGRKPTAAECEAVPKSQRNAVSSDEIEKAFDAGDVQLSVSTMKCVGYDEAFQRQLWKEFPIWSKKSKSQVQPTTSSTAGGRKRKRADSLESQSTDVDSKDEGSNTTGHTKPAKQAAIRSKKAVPRISYVDEEPEGLVYTPRGTKSRPIHI
ncbi:hypothetical protein GALMADRAFT_234810 [Galerina marginata CBS 339.88]|uniref:DUF6697 domain-containing protein n=1 Tax=Galerina marginata (strain CBS 339.88) TaxID=685588 RepID=A0A067U0D0_GALM3|nr:hypothetical protein GALMADRAFT_234810 [Galerina marginata CBS 339.88]